MYGWCYLLALSAISLSSVALGEDLQGVVRLYGSALQSLTLITPEKETQGSKLCSSDIELRIRHLTDLFVQVSGDWQTNKKGDRDCYEAKFFKVLRFTNGRNAAVGILKPSGMGFMLVGDDNKQTPLADLPDGVKKFLGQSVILDLKTVADPAAKEATNVVVSYRGWP